MSHVSNVQRTAQRETLPIHFLQGKDSAGRDCYFFVMSPTEKVNRMLNAAYDDGLDLSEFDIVAQGFGTHPSEAVTELLKKYYSFDPELLLRKQHEAAKKALAQA